MFWKKSTIAHCSKHFGHGAVSVTRALRECFLFQMAKGQKLSFAENFALSGAAAVISKTAAAPIERVKLLVQNQAEMLKQGRIDKPYSGVIDCTTRTMKTEGELTIMFIFTYRIF